jgi:hypothetical protein
MYAWCVAVHKNGVLLTHELPPQSRLMAQPPHDWQQGAAAFLHYTWGTLYHQDGKEIWRFDKRDWTAKEHELKVRPTAGKMLKSQHTVLRQTSAYITQLAVDRCGQPIPCPARY